MQHNSMFTPLQVKFDAGDDKAMTFSGYAAKFGNIDSYGDMVAPGAFKKTIEEMSASGSFPAMLWQHDPRQPIGIWTSMAEDKIGLKVEGRLAETEKAREVHTLLKMTPRPAVKGMSIGYQTIRAKRRENPEDPRRTLEEVKLWEVSLVTFPADRHALVESVKGFADLSAEQIRELEASLREKGLSRSNAVTAISGLKEWSQRDVGQSENDLRDEGSAAELADMIRRKTNQHHTEAIKWHLMKSKA